jgi:hypothetical protein
MAQIIAPGVSLQLCGHPAKILGIVKTGVRVYVNNREIVLPFEQIETALKQQK